MNTPVEKIKSRIKTALLAGNIAKIFTSLISDINEIDDFEIAIEIIESLEECDSDSSVIGALFAKALSLAENPYNILDIVELISFFKCVNLPGLQLEAKALFTNELNKLIEEHKSQHITGEICDLAELVSDYPSLKGKELAHGFLKKAVNYCKKPQDYCDIAATLADDKYVGDKMEAKSLYKIAISNASTAQELSYIACSIFDDENLGDKEESVRLLSKAISITNNADNIDFLPGVYRSKDYFGGAPGLEIYDSCQVELTFDGNHYYEGEWELSPFDSRYYVKRRINRHEFLKQIKQGTYRWVREL